jgi:membrane-bound acyltransferase YfiQ involved in biofilm formation
MKALLFASLLFLSVISLTAIAQEQQVVVPYTLADRDRAILTEARINALDVRISALDARIEVKFESQQRQLDDIKTLFFWGFGILISLFIFMLGYMIWDRRFLAEILRTHGML